MGSALYQFLAVLTGKFDCNLFSSNQLIILNTITSIGNLGTLTYRISVGWMAIALILYNSDKSPLPSGRMEMSYLSWVSSMLGIGGVVGTIAAGLMADRFGRKYTLLAAAIPQIVSESKTIVVVFFCLIQMFSKMFFHTDQLFADYLCTKCLLFACIEIFEWLYRRCYVRCDSVNGGRNRGRSVSILNSIVAFPFSYFFFTAHAVD